MKTIKLTNDNTAWMISTPILRRDDIVKGEDIWLPPKIKADALVEFVNRYNYKEGDKLDVSFEASEYYQFYQLACIYAFQAFFEQWDQEDMVHTGLLCVLRSNHFYETRLGVGYCLLGIQRRTPFSYESSGEGDLETYFYDLNYTKEFDGLSKNAEDLFWKEVQLFVDFANKKAKWLGWTGLIDAVAEWDELQIKLLTQENEEKFTKPCPSCKTKMRLLLNSLGGYLSCGNCRRRALAGVEVYSKCSNCGSNQVERVLPNGKLYKACSKHPKCREIEL